MNETKTIDVLDVKGKKAGSAELPGDLFDVNTNIPLIHQVVVAQLAAARQGTTPEPSDSVVHSLLNLRLGRQAEVVR